MEIERKYLVAKLPDQLETYPCRLLEQGYLNTNPVVRIRRDNEKYELTYKSAGLMSVRNITFLLTGNPIIIFLARSMDV